MHPQIYVVVWKTHLASCCHHHLEHQTLLLGSRNGLSSIRRHHCIAGLLSPSGSTGDTSGRSSGPTVNSRDFTEMTWSGTGREPRDGRPGGGGGLVTGHSCGEATTLDLWVTADLGDEQN